MRGVLPRGPHPRDRHPRESRRRYAARGSAARGCTTTRTNCHRTGRPVAPAGDQDTGTGPGTAKPSATCTDRSLATCAGSQCRRGPSGVRAASPAADLPAAPLQPVRAAPCHLRRPGSSQNLLSGYPSAQAAPAPAVPRGPASRAPRGSGPGTASSSVRPRPATACAEPWLLPSQSRARARLAGQHLGETGHGPDSCPYANRAYPVGGHLVCS